MTYRCLRFKNEREFELWCLTRKPKLPKPEPSIEQRRQAAKQRYEAGCREWEKRNK